MRNFIKQTFASLIGSLLGLFIFGGISTVGFFLLVFAAASSDSGPKVKDSSMLVFDLSTQITDGKPDSGLVLQQALSGNYRKQMTLRSVLDALEKARTDKQIVGVYLDARDASGAGSAGFATLKEIRQALAKFRDSGKKVVAYGVGWGEKEYYLSSVANTVMVNPYGGMEINGFSSQPMFLAGALEKFGVGVQIVRVGKFKGAVEPLVLKQLSPENREQIQTLLNDLWGEWRGTVGKSRKMTPQQLQTIADTKGLLEPDEAKTNRLVDKVAYFDEVVTELKEFTKTDSKEKSFKQIDIDEYAQIADKSLSKRSSENKIAVVYAEGGIVNGNGDAGEVGGTRFAKIFRRLRQDKDVKAVVLRVNSPGGSATASEIIQREIKLTRDVKPVVVSMGDTAASGGYWIAVDSNRIFAEPNTITGSIGVFGSIPNIQKLANDNGITWDSVKTGKYADIGTTTRPQSQAELAIFQNSVNRIYNKFLEKVAKGRNLPQAKVAEIAQGRVWSGKTAKDIGLVDEIGGLDAAIEYAATEAKLGEKWQLQEYPKASSFSERFFGKASEETQTIFKSSKNKNILESNHPLTVEFKKLKAEIAAVQNMNDPSGVYARLPFNLIIE
ncbi:signal peptide peptidase SppA, 67K type [Rivularia sp. PCC 7116]|uniref:signal peptide peptidase SppA n=1 Tax=Rivularia sp. PCC 7116 TaxID=373994 RepID=UPI00029F36DC|nr:signal peptide peptidase SppA [Rivularia sp. PCC 7116]AFY58375.1 signal peptide peptidase SppA, 67K type [Rivularia sp. PCC 7116]